MLRKLSSFLLVLNPISGFMIVLSIMTGHWYLCPLFIILVHYNMKLYFYTHDNKSERTSKLNKLLND